MMSKGTYILLRIEFLVVIVTFLFLAMSIMDIFRRRFHSPLIKSIFNILDAVSDSIVVYILGAMKTARIKNQLFPVWAIVLVNFRNSIDFISGYGVPDRRGRRFTEWRNVVKLLGVGFLNTTSHSKFLLPLWSLWSLQILRSFYRLQTRNLAFQSMWHGHSSSLISEYMRADREPGNFKDADCDPQTMQGYKYLVYGETKRNVTLQKPQYVLRIDPYKQQRRKRNTSIDTLTTLDKIWQCDGHLLHHSNSQGHDLKDLSLAFALYRLLRCRLEDVTLHEDAIRVNQKMIRARIVEEENDMRTFRVMEFQLAFLNDYYNTRYPMVFWCGLPSLLISLALSVATFAVACWLSVDIRRVIKPPEGDTTHHVHGFNVDVSITWAFMFFMMFKEIWEIVAYLLSDWTRLLLTCLYQRCKCKCMRYQRCKCKCMRSSFAEGIILSFFKSKIITERWHGVIDQYVFLQSYDSKPRIWNLLHNLTVGMVEKKDEGTELGKAIGIPDCVKPAILDRLRSLNLTHASLTKTITSLPENGPRMEYRWACLELPTCSHIILVWHIATSLCEIKLAKGNGVDLTKPGFLYNLLSCFTKCCSSKSYLMDENKLSGKLQESYVIANSLSRYCTYLLVSKPEMIPDSFLVPKMVLQETIRHARDQILKDHDSLQSRYDKLMEQAENAAKEKTDKAVAERWNVLQQGAILGYQLISLESEENRWVILSEVWAELLVHLAPSWNAAAHKKSLESGGEFITHIWALLWHCGIEKSKLWPVEGIPYAPGARAPQDDNVENGNDQTKQADAKIGGKEKADTSKSDLMLGATGAQVQNGKPENRVHGKAGINVITQIDFVERADVDGTWIDHQTEEHSDQEEVVLVQNTHAEDVHDKNNAPGARASRDDDAESGIDQTEQEMQQADAKLGEKEEVNTIGSEMQRADAQVQNGQAENGIHEEDEITVIITQRNFMECADVDGTWIDQKTEEHSHQEDAEEQKQMAVLVSNMHAEDVPDENDAPGARVSRDDDAESGNGQTEQEMQQANAKPGIKEVNTTGSEMQRAGAQVQNGQAENGVHEEDGINVIITQRNFVERAEMDGTWIDQTKEHSDQEGTEEQKQTVGRKTYAEDDAGEGNGIPLPHKKCSTKDSGKSSDDGLELVSKRIDASEGNTGMLKLASADIRHMSGLADRHRSVVRGMKNLGSTCYFNAVLQSLLALGNMRVSMLEPDALPLKGSLGQELKNLFMETTYGNNDASIPLVPENLFNILCSRNSKFQRGVTEDSNIMLISLLDGLSDEEPRMVESLFYGQVGKHLCCTTCGHAKYKDGEKLDLSLAIPSKKPVSVEDCLYLYAQGNIEDWPCTNCFSAAGSASTNQIEQSDSGTQISVPDNNNGDEHQMEQSQKLENKICRTVARESNKITKAPPVLIIQLKRFNYDPHAPHDKTQKLGEPVTFEETLDITNFMHPRHTENEYYKYGLVAVIVHEGQTLDGGHYITFVRANRIGCQQQVNGASSTWFYVSDEHIRDATLEEVLGSQAYILFYERLKQPNVNTSMETQLIDHSSAAEQ